LPAVIDAAVARIHAIDLAKKNLSRDLAVRLAEQDAHDRKAEKALEAKGTWKTVPDAATCTCADEDPMAWCDACANKPEVLVFKQKRDADAYLRIGEQSLARRTELRDESFMLGYQFDVETAEIYLEVRRGTVKALVVQRGVPWLREEIWRVHAKAVECRAMIAERKGQLETATARVKLLAERLENANGSSPAEVATTESLLAQAQSRVGDLKRGVKEYESEWTPEERELDLLLDAFWAAMTEAHDARIADRAPADHYCRNCESTLVMFDPDFCSAACARQYPGRQEAAEYQPTPGRACVVCTRHFEGGARVATGRAVRLDGDSSSTDFEGRDFVPFHILPEVLPPIDVAAADPKLRMCRTVDCCSPRCLDWLIYDVENPPVFAAETSFYTGGNGNGNVYVAVA
jgi:hypothetical protein